MGRAAKYTDEQILDAAAELIAEDGAQAASAVAIAARLGAPSGSIYHRFASRDLLLATLWIRTVKRFQRGFLAALTVDDPREAAERAVRHTIEWTDSHQNEARILTMYHREELITLWPDELGDELDCLNAEVANAITNFTIGHFGVATPEALGKATFALVDLPHAAARHTLWRSPPPAWITGSVLDAAAAVLGIAKGST